MSEDPLLTRIFEDHPISTLIVDGDVRVLLANGSARALLGPGEVVLRAQPRRGGDLLHCAHRHDHAGGCGSGEHCRACVIRSAVDDALRTGPVQRRAGELTLLRDGEVRCLEVLVSATPLELEGARLAILAVELPVPRSLPVVSA
jgi:hypothetical protein